MEAQIKRLRDEIVKLGNDAQAIYTTAEGLKRNLLPEERSAFDAMVTDGKAKRKELDSLLELQSATAGVAGGATVPDPRAGGKDALSDGPAQAPYGGQNRKSWGTAVVESDAYKHARANWLAGKMDRVQVGDSKAITSATAQGGVFVRPDRQPEVLDIARQRPFSILDMVNVIDTESDSIEYIAMESRTNNAAVVPQLDAGRAHVVAGAGVTAEDIAADRGNFQENFAMKPKGDISFALRTALVKTIAEWVPAHRQILADAPRLRGTVDTELTYMLRVKLEDMIVAANETGFVGLLNASNIGVRQHRVAGRGFKVTDSIGDTLRRMQTDIQLAFYEMDAYILSPTVAEDLELEKGADEHYVQIYDPVQQRIWRKRVAISNALVGPNERTAIAGNFAIGATLWDRQDVQVRVGEPGNFFLENAVAILAELRAAFAVVRGQAFEKATAL